MLVKDLIQKINKFDAKIIFDPKEVVANNIRQGVCVPLYFSCIEGSERKKYEALKSKAGYKSHSAAIHIPDLTVDELIDTFECDGTGSYELTAQLIKPYLQNGVPENTVFVCYLFLHEIGHWLHFKELGYDVQRYSEKDLALYQENHRKLNQIWSDRKERMDRGIMCQLTAREKERLKQCRDEYRQIPNEQIADKFAFENLNSVLAYLL